jgi:uncharacterized protein YbjQ (UPF0145 family)
MEVLIPVGLLLVGWVAGRTAESRHYRAIRARESAQLEHPAVTLKTVPGDRRVARTALAVGSVVVANDYFKMFVSSLRSIVGGEVRSFSSLLDRGRREALLRMKESSPGAHLYLNTRFETASIGGDMKQGIPCVEVMAYATAVYFEEERAA